MVICRSGVSLSPSHVLFSGARLRESEWVRLQRKESFGNTGEGKPVTQKNVKREGRREYWRNMKGILETFCQYLLMLFQSCRLLFLCQTEKGELPYIFLIALLYTMTLHSNHVCQAPKRWGKKSKKQSIFTIFQEFWNLVMLCVMNRLN